MQMESGNKSKAAVIAERISEWRWEYELLPPEPERIIMEKKRQTEDRGYSEQECNYSQVIM